MTSDDAPTPGRAHLTATVATRADRRERVRPIPIDWISTAAKLPGRSLHVAMAVWCLAVLRKSKVATLSNVASIRFGADRNSKYRGLAWLEQAGLIKVERRLGRAPIVTILDAGGDRERQS